MPDDGARVKQIERGIDRDVAGAVALASHPSGAVTVAPRNMAELFEFAKLMAVSGPCVRGAFRGNPGACLALAMQAFKWGADPFAVANKAYIVKNRGTGEDQIAYEAQLVHAIINTRAPLQRRLRTSYSGEGTKRSCTVSGFLMGEDKPFEYVSPKVEEISVKNSPLWTADRDQQLHYYSTRAWARRWCPEILLGIYTPEEMRGEIIDIEAKDVTAPRPRPEDFVEHAAPVDTETPSFEVVDFVGEFERFPSAILARTALLYLIDKARSLDALEGLWESNGGRNDGSLTLGSVIADIAVAIEDGAEPLFDAYEEAKKSFEQNSGNGQDRPATGVQQSDPAQGAATSAGATGQTEHPRGTTSTPTPERTQELPAADMATQHAAAQPNNSSGDRPWDTASKVAQHAPRDEAFWSKNKFQLPGEKPKEILYYLSQYLRQCRDLFDVNGLEADNAARFEQMAPADRREAEQMIAGRRKEIGGAKA